MDEFSDILSGHIAFEPTADADVLFAQVPAKSCVALLLDASGGALQLLCTKNLRAMLRRRLGPSDETDVAAAPSKRVDYRALVRGIVWRRVDSEFEMDLIYLAAARRAFPTHWRRLIPDRAAHFVAINPTHTHPDFTRTADAAAPDGTSVFGPFSDRAKADRWIEAARDAFNLCRYKNILVQTPRGRACAYKQMNKCPAPCDGTTELDVYRLGVGRATQSIASPAALIAELESQMKAHAGRLEFEQAGKLKSRLSTLAILTDGVSRTVRPIAAFAFVTVQAGPRKNTAKVFAIRADAVVEIVGILDANGVELDQLQALLSRELIAPAASASVDALPADVLLGAVCFHLSSTKSAHRFAAQRDLNAIALSSLVADAARGRATAEESGEAIRETRVEL